VLERTHIRVDVGDVAPVGAAAVTVQVVRDRATVPVGRPLVACCFAGGGMTSGYFSLVSGDPATDTGPASYDMAARLAAAGIVVVLVDHLATGGSDTPEDPWTLVPETVADVDAAAATRAVAALGLADPLVVGVGHSMGAMLLAYQQARHRPYDGLVMLGHAGRGMPEVLGPDELAVAGDPDAVRAAIGALVKARFGQPLQPPGRGAQALLVGPDLSERALAALRGCAAPLINLCGLTSMIPGAHDHVLTAVDVPVLLGLAEHDIARPAHETPSRYPASRDVTLFVLPGAHHNANVAPRRAELWERVVAWIAQLRLPATRL
jgi:alpha-beta hydrolase superfamily lysophospholipase